MFKIYTQNAFCFPGCLPEGYGPESNGDCFDSREDALADALDYMQSVLQEERERNGDSRTVDAVWRACREDLKKTGETDCTLPYRMEEGCTGEETDEISDNGYRFVSVVIVEESTES